MLASGSGDQNGERFVADAAKAILPASAEAQAGIQYAQFGELVRRSLIELARRQGARLSDNYSIINFDAFFDPARPPDTTFAELTQQYSEMRRSDASANGHSSKSVEKNDALTALIREIIGEDTLVRSIDYDSCLRVRNLIAQIPANRTKLYPHKSTEQAIELSKSDKKPNMGFITQSDYIRVFRDILELAHLKRLIPNNPATSLQPLKRDDVALDRKRSPFTQEQVCAFFKSPFYNQFMIDSKNPYTKVDKDWRFWLPLICAFMGMRPLESVREFMMPERCGAAGS